MKEREKLIVVGWDFTEHAELALDHALFYSYQSNMKVCLVHIAKRKSDVEHLEKELAKEVHRIYQSKGKRVNMKVAFGSVSKGLKTVAEEISAAFVFVGTSGIKGMEKLMGSYILKTIRGSEIPFIVVQGRLEKHSQFSFVCPIDSRKESKGVLYWVVYLARIFRAKISLVYPEYENKSSLLKTKANLNFSKRYLNARQIDYESVKLQANRFNDAIVNFAKKKHASLIFSITNRQAKVQNYIATSKIQYLIANKEKIPVLCISPRKDLWTYGGYK